MLVAVMCLASAVADEADLLIGRWRLVPFFHYNLEGGDQKSLKVREYPDHDERAIIEFVSRDRALLIDDHDTKEVTWKIEPSDGQQWSIALGGAEEIDLILIYIHLDEQTLLFNLYDPDENSIVSGIMESDPE
jgi:hypothetical protein